MSNIAYIGCRTTKERNARGKGIRVMKASPEGWEGIHLVENLVNPSFQCMDQTGKFLYSIHGDFSEISAFSAAEDGTLTYLNTVSTGSYLIVSCQGCKAGFGQVDVFRIHSDNGTLEKTCTVRSREIAEPRHFVFHPKKNWCYGVNEKDYSVTAYTFDPDEGTLTPRQILPTLPDTYTGDGWASGIIMMPDGKHVVVSNRKHDSITSFRIREDGLLQYCDCIKAGGGQPRFITVSPWGTVIAANETTDLITEFSLDAQTGKFSATGWSMASESPVCLIFA